MQYNSLRSNWLRFAWLPGEISHTISSISVVWRTKSTLCPKTNASCSPNLCDSFLPQKPNSNNYYFVIRKRRKITNLSTEYGISEQQVSNRPKSWSSPQQWKNDMKIIKRGTNALFFALIFTFLIIHTLDYLDQHHSPHKSQGRGLTVCSITHSSFPSK